jgi:hypothetical protein
MKSWIMPWEKEKLICCFSSLDPQLKKWSSDRESDALCAICAFAIETVH